jgi:hypothetical protein
MIAGLAAHSRVVSAGFGSYGAAMSVYYHFLARGREVVYPRDRAMVIGLGKREKSADGFWRPFLAKNSEGTSEAKDRSKMQA